MSNYCALLSILIADYCSTKRLVLEHFGHLLNTIAMTPIKSSDKSFGLTKRH